MTYPDLIEFFLLTFAACVMACTLVYVIHQRMKIKMHERWSESAFWHIEHLNRRIEKMTDIALKQEVK